MAKKEKEVISENNNDILLEEYEVWDIIKYAQSLSGLGDGLPISMDILNARMKDITLLNTGEVTESEVTDALNAPKESEQELLRISEHFELISSMYKRLLSYLGNMPSFDYTYTCTNATPKDYKKGAKRQTAYESDEKILKDFVTSLDLKQEFSKVSRQLLRSEVHFSVFRDEGEKFVLQELPQDRCRITGRFDYGLLFSFDYNWFLSTGVDINMYPDIFKKEFLEYRTLTDGTDYRPSNSISDRGGIGGSQVNWVDCSPVDGFWCFKFTPEMVTRVPYFAGMFPDLVQESTIRALQKSSYMASASKILTGEVPLLEGAKAKVKDAISITPDLLGKFLQLFKNAINSDAVKVAASPLQNMKAHDFKSDPDIRTSFLRTTLGASGASTNLLFAGDVKPNMAETMLSLAVDEILMMSIYPQFNDFVNWHVNRLTKKFKFELKFEGTNFYSDRLRRKDDAMEMANLGIVLPQKIAAAQGMSPFEMQAQMDMASANGWVDKLTPIVLAPQLAKEEGAGAPKKKDTEISDEGAQTQSDGGNESKKA